MKYEKSCGAVIFRKTRGKYAVLLIKNRYADFWSFPKGHVEDGENEYQTAIREVKEETGIDIKIENGFRMESVYLIGKKKNIEKKVVYFASLTTRAYVEPQAEEISAFHWFFEEPDGLVPADNAACEDLFYALTENLYMEKSAAEAVTEEELAQYGLDDPFIEVTIDHVIATYECVDEENEVWKYIYSRQLGNCTGTFVI